MRKWANFQNFGVEPVKKPCVQVEHGVFQRLPVTRPTSTFAPMHYEKNYAYPLIVWLHGDGMNETQLLRVMPMISLRNYMAVSLRGNPGYDENGKEKPGFYWSREGYDEALAGVLECVEVTEKQYHISPKKIYVAGSGGGGSMALRLAFKNPNFFTGVISLDGPVPDDGMMLEHLKELRKVRIMIGLSRGSEKYPVEAFCAHLPVLHAAGLQVTVRNYPTAGALQTDMLRDVDRWIMGSIDSAVR